MEVRNHLAHARNASRHRPDQVVLVAVIDPHIGIGRPDQNRVNSAVSFFQIVEIAIDGVAVRYRIVEIAVLYHHLWLEETGLGPLKCRHIVAGTLVADANASFIAPVTDVGQPGIMLALSARGGSTFPSPFHDEAAGSGNLLTFGMILRVLSGNAARDNQEDESDSRRDKEFHKCAPV